MSYPEIKKIKKLAYSPDPKSRQLAIELAKALGLYAAVAKSMIPPSSFPELPTRERVAGGLISSVFFQFVMGVNELDNTIYTNFDRLKWHFCTRIEASAFCMRLSEILDVEIRLPLLKECLKLEDSCPWIIDSEENYPSKNCFAIVFPTSLFRPASS